MRTFLIIGVAIASLAADYPKMVLKNDTIELTVQTPNEKTGFYRGTRFDWAGVIGPVKVHGKTIFLPWKDSHNPANNDDITGPCDEFGMNSPLGYADAKVGGRFLKIGVGELTKGKDEEYAFWKKYEIAKVPTWESLTTDRVPKNAISFRQNHITDFGYGYDYSKSIVLQKNGFVLRYRLHNTGTKPIETDVYNHNFFNVEGASTGPGFAVTYAFPPKANQPKERFEELVKVADKRVSLTKALDKGSIYTLLDGFGDSTDHAKFTIEGGGVRMTVKGDQPLSKVALWGVKQTLCPEPFIAIKLAPGQIMAWSWDYSLELTK